MDKHNTNVYESGSSAPSRLRSYTSIGRMSVTLSRRGRVEFSPSNLHLASIRHYSAFDTDICVRTHAHCTEGHYLRYASWSWALKNGANVRDPGFCSGTTKQRVYTTVDDTIILDRLKETALVPETISEMATRSIFGWLRSYGWPAPEKVIYSHSWIILEGSDDEPANDPEDDVSDPGKVKYTSDKFERITAWLDQCAKESESG